MAKYIFQRDDSAMWWIKLRSGGRRIEQSLGTSDRREAEIIALPMIAEHKARLLAARPRIERIWRHRFEPGRLHTGEDGSRIFATDTELHYLDHNGETTKIERNGEPDHQFVYDTVPKAALRRDPAVRSFARAFARTYIEHIERGPLTRDSFDRKVVEAYSGGARPTVPKKNSDDGIFETYIHHANITGYYEREARDTFRLFKTLTDNKPLKDCTRDDGRKLVEHFAAKGLRTASVKKKISWLNAMANFALLEGALRFNPFVSIVPKADDAARRVPLDDADMTICKGNLGTVSDADQLLFRLLASTGMRLGEAFQISSEATEHGVRYVIVGTKTESSRRRVPLPAAVLPFLPKIIKGPLFAGGAPAASKRLNKFLRDSGVATPMAASGHGTGKVVHSLRHRAADRLRAAGAPVDIRHAILGHEARTVADGYGAGHPVPLLKQWIDTIGF